MNEQQIHFTFQATPQGVMLTIPLNLAVNLSVFLPLELMKAMSRDIAKAIQQEQNALKVVNDIKRGV